VVEELGWGAFEDDLSAIPAGPWAHGPTLGSSKTYVMSVRLEPRWRTTFSRCDSPPDNVDDAR
jgi:hypothetical protein